MGELTLQGYIDKVVKEIKAADFPKVGKYKELADTILKSPAMLLELASRIKHVSSDIIEILQNDEQLNALNDTLAELKRVRSGFARQSKRQNIDKHTKDQNRELIKQADAAIALIASDINKILLNRLDRRYDDVAKSIIKSGVKSKPKLSERTLKMGGREYTYGDYIKKLRRFQYRFYSLSDNADPEKLQYYQRLADSDDIIDYIDKASRRSMHIDFTFRFNPTLPLQFSLDDIDEFTENLKTLALVSSKMFKHDKVDCINSDFIKKENGDNCFNETFDIWARYLRVYELNKEKNPIGIGNNKGINVICQIITKEFGLSTKTTVADRRKAIREDYARALEMIARAEKGSLLA